MSIPPNVRLTLVQRDGDGETVTPYAPAAAPTEDPYVRRRLAPQGGGGAGVITEYAPAPARPSSYPAWLPFLPGRPAFTTESPDGGGVPGARWPCADAADATAVRTALAAAAATDGWAPAPGLRPPAPPRPGATAQVFVRGDAAHVVFTPAADEATQIVQLLALPRAALRAV